MAFFEKYLIITTTILIHQYAVHGAPVTENFLTTETESLFPAAPEADIERKLRQTLNVLKDSLYIYCPLSQNRSTSCDRSSCQERVEQYENSFDDFVIANVSQSLINSYHRMQRTKMDICMEETLQKKQDSRNCCCTQNFRFNNFNDLRATNQAGRFVDQLRNLLEVKNIAITGNDCVIPRENCTDIVHGPQRDVAILLAFASTKKLLDDIINERSYFV